MLLQFCSAGLGDRRSFREAVSARRLPAASAEFFEAGHEREDFSLNLAVEVGTVKGTDVDYLSGINDAKNTTASATGVEV